MKLTVTRDIEERIVHKKCKGCIHDRGTLSQYDPYWCICEIVNLVPWMASCIREDFIHYERDNLEEFIEEEKEKMKCDKCELNQFTISPCIEGSGKKDGKVMLVGMCPGEDEERVGRVFVGKSGALLTKGLYEAGLRKEDIYITNLVKCRLIGKDKKNRPPSKDEAKFCASIHLEKEIEEMKPDIIVPLGADAYKYLAGSTTVKITKDRGRAQKSEKYKSLLFPMFHPSAVLRTPELLPYFNKDLGTLKSLVVNDNSYQNPPKTQENKGQYVTIDTEEKLEMLYDRLNTHDLYSIDIETSNLDFKTGKIIGIGFSWKEGTGVYVPLIVKDKEHWEGTEIILEYKKFWGDKTEKILDKLREVINREGAAQILQNFSFDIKFFWEQGIKLNVIADTILMAHLYNENLKGRYNLDDLAREFLGMAEHKDLLDAERDRICKERNDYIKGVHKQLKKEGKVDKKAKPKLWKKTEVSYADVPLEILAPYGCLDVDKTLKLYNHFLPELEKLELTRLFKQITMPYAKILAEIEYKGLKIDVELLHKIEAEYRGRIEEAEKSMFNTIGREINLNSPKQLQELLFQELKLRPLKETKTGYSTDAETLEYLRGKHKAVDSILAFREVSHVYTTYIKGYIERLDENNRLYPNFLVFGTTSGRLSCASPNVQNLPKKGPFRNLFIPSNKDSVILDVDFEQAELRVITNESGDKGFMETFEKGEDAHAQAASDALGIPLEEVTEEHRSIGKCLNFGLNYGRGPDSIVEQIGISLEEAERLVENYFMRHKEVKRFMKNTIAEVSAKKEVINMLKRRRRLPGIDSAEYKIKGHCEREAINFMIQSTSHDILTITAIRVYNKLKEGGYKARIINEIHDELVFDVPKSELEEVSKIVKEEMERPVEGMKVPMKIESKVSDRWLSKE